MNNIKHYPEIISLKYCCVPCLLEIIIYTEYSIFINQLYIANYFGVNVPIDYNGPIKNVNRKQDINEHGIVLKHDSINIFFRENKIPLIENYKSIYCLDDLTFIEFIENNIASSHLIVGYDYGLLFEKKENKAGHVSLLLNYFPNNGFIEIYDPGPESPGKKLVSISLLYDAIKSKKDGIWQINSAIY